MSTEEIENLKKVIYIFIINEKDLEWTETIELVETSEIAEIHQANKLNNYGKLTDYYYELEWPYIYEQLECEKSNRKTIFDLLLISFNKNDEARFIIRDTAHLKIIEMLINGLNCEKLYLIFEKFLEINLNNVQHVEYLRIIDDPGSASKNYISYLFTIFENKNIYNMEITYPQNKPLKDELDEAGMFHKFDIGIGESYCLGYRSYDYYIKNK